MWSLNGLGRSTNPRIGMLISSAIPAASGAQTSPATEVTASSRLRTLHQHQSPSRTMPSIVPYSPTNSMTRSNQPGASAASPLMS